MYNFCYINATKNRKNLPICTIRKKNNDLRQQLEKKINDVKSFNISIISFTEMNTDFKDKNHKSKKKYKKYKTLTTILKSIDTIVNIAATSSSITFVLTGIGLIVVPLSTGIAVDLRLVFKILYEIVMQNYIKYKKQYQKQQQSIQLVDKLCTKSLQDDVIDNSEYETLCTFFNF